jgi:ribonuclease T2
MRRLPVVLLVLLCAAGLSLSQGRRDGGGASRPGVFDYYLFSLSWSPEHCASPAGRNDSFQCASGRRFGFVVHGLWPQFERGYPEDCGSGPELSRQQVDSMLDLMPSPKLVRHEWGKHGVCSGLPPGKYFETIRAARAAFRVPPEFDRPSNYITIEPRKLKQKLLAANPSIPPEAMAVLCSGRYLDQVRVCYTKDLKPRPCGAGVRDNCRAEKVILRPVR